ncbi:hypothetical protein GTY20_32020 [Streptomyces sp. SID4946]|uniref:hypothetical protein n=1 Tax=Streptomyces sp. LamerLS-31b TaxID=1839765 RepID=UPI00081F45BA|nr:MULTISPECIES: hypothetical protein [unclassified Streptomyces]MYQ95569.1 hypothetical protein [Streptomyces sp. SID4946]SCF96296.1 hypothetical protein GA0115256_137432 [Streptomyces sp. DconLS]SCG01322.1 hypothetical protein GA0115258_124230 [Streptomyces sp. LamerLS-31b]
MQHHIRRTALVAVVLVVAAVLGGCSGQPRKVSGLLDTTQRVPATSRLATRPHLVRQCHSGSKQVRHTSGRGSKKRTWYTTRSTTVCTKVRRGTETYRRVIRQERWCVMLDDVGGKRSRDRVWYQVGRNTYTDTRVRRSGSKVTIEPERDGC